MQNRDLQNPPLALLAGQSHHTRLSRGTVIHVVTGQIAIKTRIWLDNAVPVHTMPVNAGGIYVVASSGDFEIVALKPAQVLRHPPPPILGPLSWPGFLKKVSPDRTRGVQAGLLNNAARA